MGSMHSRRRVRAGSHAWYAITSSPSGVVTTLLCPGPTTVSGMVTSNGSEPAGSTHGPSGRSATA